MSSPHDAAGPSGRISLQASADDVRRSLKDLLSAHALTDAAWLGGELSLTPGTAFFFGYQCAMRCVDPALRPDQWAAFCVSEKGVKSLRDMSTVYAAESGLSGVKSHAMLAGRGLDTCYVIARAADDPGQLVCVVATPDSSGVQIHDSGKPQPFMTDLPHLALSFADTPARFFCADANERLNKPFRCWEDVHGVLALAAWVASWLPAEQALPMRQQADVLAKAFAVDTSGYRLPVLNAVEALFALTDELSASLPTEQKALWQRDRMLMVFTQALRAKIREKLSAQSR
ncbi:hypothetical protein ACQUQU_12910 [Thalassolituus sp. LLYu03]|uniref:hypothetical protein n=1 Tax=Thalassolituus sp. LLYu03 TaxID=3421656 RepID=UPI003D2A7CC3